ncbi:MAG: hypothetical protein U5Q03_10755 [Bacteroidota bacterium]|nr:hypothetical protein [Bacteroidota bacterium]
MDILVKDDEGWKAYEVKGSTNLKNYHIDDTSLQYYVIIPFRISTFGYFRGLPEQSVCQAGGNRSGKAFVTGSAIRSTSWTLKPSSLPLQN